MNTKRLLLLLTTLSFLSTLGLQLSTAFAQGTGFTYQGRLNEGGSPANGVYDFTFQAFDAPSAGNSVGGTVNVNAVVVSNGLFTALVDLGSSPFTGPARWLQISVSTNGAGSFSTLFPRQPLTPSPYAIFAGTAGTVTNGAIANAQLAASSVTTGKIQDNTVTGGKIASGQVVKSLNGLTDGVSLTQGANVTINTVGNSLQISAPAGGLNLPFSGTAAGSGSIFTLSNSASGAAGAFLGNVGIGTTSPQARLHVRTPDEGIRIQGQSSGVNNLAYMTFLNGSGTRIGYVGDGGGADNSIYLQSDSANVHLYTAVGAALTATPGGNVGIGTATPGAKLDVRGDIRLGPSGELRATSGEENLRIVRGVVRGDGTIHSGLGFTVTVLGTGKYQINFAPAFASAPAVTTNCEVGSGFFSRWTFLFNNRVEIWVGDSSLNFQNGNFSFIAIGPR